MDDAGGLPHVSIPFAVNFLSLALGDAPLDSPMEKEAASRRAGYAHSPGSAAPAWAACSIYGFVAPAGAGRAKLTPEGRAAVAARQRGLEAHQMRPPGPDLAAAFNRVRAFPVLRGLVGCPEDARPAKLAFEQALQGSPLGLPRIESAFARDRVSVAFAASASALIGRKLAYRDSPSEQAHYDRHGEDAPPAPRPPPGPAGGIEHAVYLGPRMHRHPTVGLSDAMRMTGHLRRAFGDEEFGQEQGMGALRLSGGRASVLKFLSCCEYGLVTARHAEPGERKTMRLSVYAVSPAGMAATDGTFGRDGRRQLPFWPGAVACAVRPSFFGALFARFPTSEPPEAELVRACAEYVGREAAQAAASAFRSSVAFARAASGLPYAALASGEHSPALLMERAGETGGESAGPEPDLSGPWSVRAAGRKMLLRVGGEVHEFADQTEVDELVARIASCRAPLPRAEAPRAAAPPPRPRALVPGAARRPGIAPPPAGAGAT